MTGGSWKCPWWRHQMGTFSASLAICAGKSPVTGEFPAQRPVTWSFDVFLICTRIHGRVNNGEAGDLRRHRTDNNVTVMSFWRNCRQSYEISVLAVPELPVQPVTECNKTYIFLVLSVTMHTISLWKYIYAHMVMFARGFLKRQTAKLRPPVRHCQIDSRSFPIYNILSFGMVVVDLFPHYKL